MLAVVAARADVGIRPINEYPRCEVCDKPTCDWGPEVILFVPWCGRLEMFVGHRDAGAWLVQDASDLQCWSPLDVAPTHWMRSPLFGAF